MTPQYKKRLIELGARTKESLNGLPDLQVDRGDVTKWILFKGELEHLLGFIEALEDEN